MSCVKNFHLRILFRFSFAVVLNCKKITQQYPNSFDRFLSFLFCFFLAFFFGSVQLLFGNIQKRTHTWKYEGIHIRKTNAYVRLIFEIQQISDA